MAVLALTGNCNRSQLQPQELGRRRRGLRGRAARRRGQADGRRGHAGARLRGHRRLARNLPAVLRRGLLRRELLHQQPRPRGEWLSRSPAYRRCDFQISMRRLCNSLLNLIHDTGFSSTLVLLLIDE